MLIISIELSELEILNFFKISLKWFFFRPNRKIFSIIYYLTFHKYITLLTFCFRSNPLFETFDDVISFPEVIFKLQYS